MNGSQGQGQPGPPRPKLFRPEQMRNLPDKFSAEEKKKWENGLTMLYGQMESNPPDSKAHQDAYKKIHDFSMTLINKIQQAAQAQRAQAQMPNQQRPQGSQPGQQNSQGGSSQQSSQPQQSQQGQMVPPGTARPQPSQGMRDHVNSFPYVAPGGLPAGSAKANEWIATMKDKYLSALMKMEQASAQLKKFDMQVQQRNAAGKPLNPAEERDYNLKKEQLTRAHGDAKRFVETFRRQQNDLMNAQKAAQAGDQGGGQGAAPAAGQQNQPQQGQQNQQSKQQQNQPQQQQQGQQNQPPQPIAVPPRPAMSLNQPAQNQAMQQTEAVQAAMQAARQQQMNGARPNVNLPGGQNNEQKPPQQVNQQMGSGSTAMPQQQGPNQAQNQNFPQNQNIKQEGSQQPINPALAQQSHIQQIQAQARQAVQNIGSPITPQNAQQQHAQSQQNLNQTPGQPQQQPSNPLGQQSGAQSNIATPISAGPPKPLSQSDAIAHAQRTYSSAQTTSTPNVMASHSHPLPQREVAVAKSNLMPIPKVLPQAAIGPPLPVSMAPNRPTMSGGQSGQGMGVMQQPVVGKMPPGFVIEGDAERVLNKRKLDELVRQVTGGGEGLEEGLAADVEDAVLSVADTFVDQVITAACLCAKARGSKTLEIRDIQLILERNYNIRIPGYASDEIRTVRKFMPAQGWINKMSAIQASKVTGGKGDL